MREITVEYNNGYAVCNCPYCGMLVHSVQYLNKKSLCCHIYELLINGNKATFCFDYNKRNIFYYKDLQEIINNLHSRKIKKDFVSRLNSNDPQIVHSAEWELVIFDWFNRFCKVEYEVDRGDGKKPDIYSEDLKLICDIASVSDSTISKIYPAGEVLDDMYNILKSSFEDRFSFEIRMDSAEKGNLDMFPPSRKEKNLSKFQKWVLKNANKFYYGASLSLYLERNKFIITVRKKDQYVYYLHQSRIYKKINSNPVYNIINSKASRQLPYKEDELVGIALCDSGCMILNSTMSGDRRIRLRDIIIDIFSQHKNIDFVLSFSIHKSSSIELKPRIDVFLHCRHDLQKQKEPLLAQLNEIFKSNIKLLRTPVLFPNISNQIIPRPNDSTRYWKFQTDAHF